MPIIDENWKMKRRYNWYLKILRKCHKVRLRMLLLSNPISDSEIGQKIYNEKQFIIQVAFGGLGDHLIYSSLPELLWKQKGIKTFISNKSIFRSKAIRDFIWGLNPYVTFTNEKGWYSYKALKHNFPTLDGYFQNLLGLQADGLPKIYYKPNMIKQLRGRVIVDPSCGVTGKANGYFEPDFYKRFIQYIKDNGKNFVLITHLHSGTKKELQEMIIKEFQPDCFQVKTIQQLADALFSAKERYLLHSGAASLSAALKLESNIVNYIKPSTYYSFRYATNRHIHLL